MKKAMIEQFIHLGSDTIKKNGVLDAAKVLELGCGAGNLALRLSQQGYDCYGIDISPTAIS
ncbi:class I SAM-dependent methyltransferase [candidate division CSSED10-310 bacterium]|uniref:Class I SAM-dependent methyltransferase n=1 Tax=candidate division CSSED10-310 bacterium TaxID=2855610 RepID=A0ABV6Z031_UNCC1